MKIKQKISARLRLLTALQCLQPIVIFQSDDWGMIRSPKNKDFIPKYGQPKVWAYDQLESVEELDKMYKILSSYRDANQNHPFVEANFIVSNPDFNATKEGNYKTIILKSICDYPQLIAKWNEGINKRVFIPQYHGRLHFNYDKMLEMIANDELSREIFDFHFHGGVNNYIGSDWLLHSEYQKWEDGSEWPYEQLIDWLQKGIQDFQKAFGFIPKSTIAPQYIFTPSTVQGFAHVGFKAVQGTNMQTYKKGNKKVSKNIPTGSRYYKGLIAISRNVKFEPGRNKVEWKYEATIKKCKLLINKNLPIIIDSHRINYVGKFAEEGLEELDKLINGLTRLGCIFLSSEEFTEAITNHGVYTEFGTHKKRKVDFKNNSKVIQVIRNQLN